MRLSRIIFITLILASCGRERIQPKDNGIGTFRSGDAVMVSDEDQDQWASLCADLEKKDVRYKLKYATIYTRFRFETQFINCKGEQPPGSGLVVAKIPMGQEKLTFEIESGKFFRSQVETHNSGLLSVLCQEMAKGGKDLAMPIKKNNIAYWFYLKGKGCKSTSNQKCVSVERAFKNDSGAYIELMEDRFYISNKPEDLGDILTHQIIDRSTCEEGESIKMLTTLKTITN